MQLIGDTHLHLYPCHDLGVAVTALSTRLDRLAPGAVRTGFFTEPRDCHAFRDLAGGDGAAHTGRFSVTPGPQPEVLTIREPEGACMYVFAGRQVVTRERIEVLALTSDASFPDGAPAAEAVQRILDAGAVPVLAWAPGKWFFERGRVVRRLLDAFAPQQMLVGDSSLRPACWPEPLLVRDARRRGFRVVAGSDPLPLAGEERLWGSYATVWEAPFDPDKPVDSARGMLKGADGRAAGRRSGPFRVCSRLRAHRKARGKEAPGRAGA